MQMGTVSLQCCVSVHPCCLGCSADFFTIVQQYIRIPRCAGCSADFRISPHCAGCSAEFLIRRIMSIRICNPKRACIEHAADSEIRRTHGRIIIHRTPGWTETTFIIDYRSNRNNEINRNISVMSLNILIVSVIKNGRQAGKQNTRISKKKNE